MVPTLLQVALLALEGLDPALNSAQLARRAWAPVALFLLRWWPNCQALVLSALCFLGLLLDKSFLRLQWEAQLPRAPRVWSSNWRRALWKLMCLVPRMKLHSSGFLCSHGGIQVHKALL